MPETLLTKVSVNMIPRAMDALNASSDREGYSRTDTLNRAIQLYDLITKHAAEGGAVLLRGKDGDIASLTFL